MSFFSAVGDFLKNPLIKGSNTDESSDATPDNSDNTSGGFLSTLGNYLSKGLNYIHDLGKPNEQVANIAHEQAQQLPSLVSYLKGNNDQSLTHRFFNEANKSIAFLPDAISNGLSGGGYLWEKDPLENAMRKIGAITDMAPANTTTEKLVGGTGSAVGSMVGPGGLAAAGEKGGAAGLAAAKSLLGTDSALTSASQLANPTFASTLGAMTAPVAAKPAIDSYTQNPTTRNLLGLGTAVMGGIGFGGLTNYLMNSPKELPLVTEAQRAIPGTPEARDLESKQLSLIGKYPKAADAVDQISTAQQQAIENNLQSGASGMKGQDVKNAIIKSVEDLKDKKSQEYATGLKALQENALQQNGEIIPDQTPLGKPKWIEDPNITAEELAFGKSTLKPADPNSPGYLPGDMVEENTAVPPSSLNIYQTKYPIGDPTRIKIQKALKLQHEDSFPGEPYENDADNWIEESVAKKLSDTSQNKQSTGANGLVQPQRADGLNLSNTSAAIDDLLSQKSEGGKVEQTLQPIISQINQNANSSLPKLASTYSDISKPTHPISGLKLGTTEQMAATRVAQAYARDIDNAYPGYEALNTQYNRNMKQLSDILNGPVGKEAKLADKTPSKVFTDIFEKTDPQLQTQAQQVLPAPLYKQAAQQYLSDVVSQAGNSTPLKNMNNTNNLDKMQAIGNVLKNKTAKEALPAAEQNIADQAIKDIQQNMTGQVKTPYTTSSRMDTSNPVVNIGSSAIGGHPVGLLAKTGDFLIGGPIKNRLQYNEMLGAGSPSSQIATSTGKNLAKLGQRINTVAPLNAPNIPQLQSNQPPITPANLTQPVGNITPINSQQPNYEAAYNSILPKEIVNNNSATQNPAIKPPNPYEAAFNSILPKDIVNDNGSYSHLSKIYTPFTPEEYKFVSDKLRNNDFNSLINFDQSFKNYQQSFEPLLRTLRGRESGNNYQNMKNPFGYVGAYQFGAPALETIGFVKPGVGRMGNAALRDPNNWNIQGGLNTFLNSPQLQDEAAKKLLSANEQALEKAGVINANTPIAQRNGYLAAAHLKGVQGAINLFHGHDSADAFGTRASDYYKMGMGI